MRNSVLSTQYKIIQQSSYKRMPWKNGLGETLEILLSEDDHGQRFRISQAAVVQDGVFSDFQGMHRTLVLLSGDGIALSLENTAAKQSRFELNTILDMARFAGGDKTYAELSNGRIEDLNVMVREADTLSEVEACFAQHTINLSADVRCLLRAFYANQTCTIELDATQNLQLHAHSFLIIEQAAQLHLSKGSGVFIQVLAEPALKN